MIGSIYNVLITGIRVKCRTRKKTNATQKHEILTKNACSDENYFLQDPLKSFCWSNTSAAIRRSSQEYYLMYPQSIVFNPA